MKKIIFSLVMIIVSIMCIANYSYGAGAQLEATIEITPSATEAMAGEEIVFTFITKNIKNAESGKIYAIGGELVYDKEFFELGTTDMTVGDTGLFNSTKPVSEGQTNGTITLKIKDNATGSGNVEFKELTASDGRLEDMETLGVAKTPDKKITITIKKQTDDENGSGNENPPADTENGGGNENPPTDNENGSGNENPPADDENQGGEQNPPTDNENNGGNETPGTTVVVGDDKKDNTTANKEIPKAGVSTILAVSIVTMTMLAILVHKKSEKYKDIK